MMAAGKNKGWKDRLTPYTPFALMFTLISLGVTAWSITGFVPDLKGAIAIAVLAEGAWIVFQVAEYRGDEWGTGRVRLVHMSFVMLILASGTNIWHGVSTQEPMLAALGGAAPIVAKISWELDRRTRIDPTQPTAADMAKHYEMIRKAKLKNLENKTQREINRIVQDDKLQAVDDASDLELHVLERGAEIAEKKEAIADQVRLRALARGDFSSLEKVTLERVEETPVEVPENPKPDLKAVPAKEAPGRTVVTMPVGAGLTESQKKRKRIAAMLYLEEDRAVAEGRQPMTQAELGRRMDPPVNPVQVSRSKSEWSRDDMTAEDYQEAAAYMDARAAS
ncbi:hypothetical protein [Streptomyces sp. 5-10]|uniref:hypothetical protein n=1 Tax=Streptomyces sp. 5-10 TaxID=878925 RepID=UPI00168A6CD0|nr:hypothetical protein [Streptomyces sp. 5-10]MBD3004844.1 hypothetical protein [Streptomyces sp. 5-10]